SPWPRGPGFEPAWRDFTGTQRALNGPERRAGRLSPSGRPCRLMSFLAAPGGSTGTPAGWSCRPRPARHTHRAHPRGGPTPGEIDMDASGNGDRPAPAATPPAGAVAEIERQMRHASFFVQASLEQQGRLTSKLDVYVTSLVELLLARGVVDAGALAEAVEANRREQAAENRAR